MANIKSAKKRARQNVKRRSANRSKKSAMRTAVKKFHAAVTEGNKEEVQSLFTKSQSLIRKLAKSSALNKKTASRLTSRLAAKVNSLKS